MESSYNYISDIVPEICTVYVLKNVESMIV